MYNRIVTQAISDNESDATAAFDHLLHSCTMTREIAEYIRENAKLRVISNRAARFAGHPTRVIEYTVYTLVIAGIISLLAFGARHVYTDVHQRNAQQHSR